MLVSCILKDSLCFYTILLWNNYAQIVYKHNLVYITFSIVPDHIKKWVSNIQQPHNLLYMLPPEWTPDVCAKEEKEVQILGREILPLSGKT